MYLCAFKSNVIFAEEVFKSGKPPGSAFCTDHIHIIPSHAESRVQVMVPMSDMCGTRDMNNRQIPTEGHLYHLAGKTILHFEKVVIFKISKTTKPYLVLNEGVHCN